MAFKLEPNQVEAAWATLTIEVVFAPKTGSLRPWEMYGCFTYPHKMRKFWGSYKTESNANKALAKLLKKYPQAVK